MTSRLILLCAAILCSGAAVRELSVWRSNSLAAGRTPECLRAALVYSPSDASKWRKLGIALLDKDPDSATAEFRRAIELNGFETDALLGLALLAESHGRQATAESLYRQAIRQSRRFKPQYALAAFYARSGRISEFWQTAVAAAAIDQANIAPVVDLARRAGADPDSIPALLNLRTEYALAAYLPIAIEQNRAKPIEQVAMRLPVTAQHRPALIQACDRLIELGAAGPAVALWNRLETLNKLDVAGGRSLTNSSFAFSAVRGFNWRYPDVPGVRFELAPAGLRIEFSGDEPERANLLEQIAPVLAQRDYRLSVRSETSELSTAAGLSWLVHCLPADAEIASAPLANPTSFRFSTPSGCNLAAVTLIYNRQSGTVRISGALNLLSARLELLP